MTCDLIIALMVPHLTIDLAPPKWQRLAKRFRVERLGFGCCYPAAEVLYNLWGKANGFKPCYLKTENVQHWYLRHPDGRIADPTACQFLPKPLSAAEYAAGRCSGFLTKELSKRGKILLARMGK